MDARLRVRHALLDSRLIGDTYLAVRSGYSSQIPTVRTEITIDGFPRSANSYAWFAFQVSNPSRGLSGHTHSSRALVRSVEAGIPAVLLLRDPGDCLPSYLQHQEGAAFASVARAFSRFHERLLPIADRLIVAPFPMVVEDFGCVIDRVNRTFGADFSRYERTTSNESEVMRRVEASMLAHTGGVHSERHVARPSSERQPADVILSRLSRRDLFHLKRAQAVHREFLARVEDYGDEFG